MGRNDVTLEGYVRKIELRFTPNGAAVLNIRVPIDRRQKNKDTGEWESVNTTWWGLSTWNEDAEFQAEHLQEGDLIQFTGMPEMELREGKDGQTFANAVMKWPRIAKVLQAPKERQNAPQGGQRSQGGGNTRPSNTGPSQGQQGDPWGRSGQQSYDWGTGNDQEPPY